MNPYDEKQETETPIVDEDQLRSLSPGTITQNDGQAKPPILGTTAQTQKIFTVSEIASHMEREEASYIDAIKKLHKSLVQGDKLSYYETHIKLPRSLQGLRTATTVAKIMELNPPLNKDDWSTVTAYVAGHILILTIFREKGRNLLLSIKKLKSDKEKRWQYSNQKKQKINTS